MIASVTSRPSGTATSGPITSLGASTLQLDMTSARQTATTQFDAQIFEEPAQIDFLQRFRFVQATMQRRERIDAAARFGERRFGARIANAPRVQVEQAHDELQIVLHAMMNFAHQHFLLRQRFAQFRFARGNQIGHARERLAEAANFRRAPRRPARAARCAGRRHTQT